MKNIFFDECAFHDIRPIFSGEQKCESLHSFGPHVREYFLIHTVLSGEGALTDKHGTHKIKAGELFIIRPGETTVYTADKKSPWHYVWVAFSGDMTACFDTEHSVYKAPLEFSHKLSELVKENVSAPEPYTALLYDLSYRLFKSEESRPNKLSAIKAYIDYNYMQNISVATLTKTFGFERSYLYRMFKSRYGIGVKEYIIKTRCEHAKKFLLEGNTVAETAYLVGYRDEFNFSRAFKKAVGKAPSEYRNRKV